MYPNPQDALPLPASPSVEQYKKLAKDLVKACKSGDSAGIRVWAGQWVDSLAKRQAEPRALRDERERNARAERVAEFAREKMSPGGEQRAEGRPAEGQSAEREERDPDGASCQLADAQFVIARAHGFLSWPKFVTHLESLARDGSDVSAFESAALAVVNGDAATLTRLLRAHPDLIRARSTREHQATLLHYVSANGVENYRQVSPKNIAEITRILLEAGAEVDAEAEVYGGGCTALGLVATSEPPAAAGVQREVIDVLLAHGARMDHRGSAGNEHTLVRGCLANGQPEAAEYLATRGAPIDLSAAAGLNRVDILQRLLDEAHAPDLHAVAPPALLADAFFLASGYGRTDAVRFFLEHGIDADMGLRGHGEGHSALHVASFHGHLDVVDLLLRHGARIDAIDKTWRTPPLSWALTGWSHASSDRARADRFYQVVARLIAAGAVVKPDQLAWEKVRNDPKMHAALTGGA